MTDFSVVFKNKLKKKAEELEYSSSSNFLDAISEELKVEQENNKVFQFKNSLAKTIKETKEKVSESDLSLFENIEYEIITPEKLIEETPLEIINDQKESDFISNIVESISKEENNKQIREKTDLFNQPNAKEVDPTIKAIQSKVKYIEDWVSKISIAGPGSGEVNFRWLDDVNRNTIGNTDQILRYDPTDKKFFFGQLSGDQGPIRSLEFDVNGAGVTPVPQMLEWNTEKDCLNIYQADNTTLQVGLEQYIKVHNGTANTLTNGTLVQFSGVNGDSETPLCVPLLANSSFISLYTVGVLTNDIPADGTGRATILGEVRNLDASGSSSGEVWSVGDLLWASPTQPGKLTKVQPTAPNPVISVASVLNTSNTNGIILVRPTIFPRLFYGSFYDTTDQTVTSQQLNSPREIRYSNTQISSGFHISNNSHIVAENAGLYNYQFSLQIDSTNASSSQNIWVWYRKNGEDVPATASRITVDRDYRVVAWNFIESMEIGEYFQLMWATDSVNVRLHAPSASAFCPSIPSVILTVSQVNL